RTSRFGRFDVKIESGTQVASRGTDMAQCDAAGVNGSNRILFHGAPLLRMMPNGCLGSPVIVLLFGLDRGFLMDVGPTQVAGITLGTSVERTQAGKVRCSVRSGFCRGGLSVRRTTAAGLGPALTCEVMRQAGTKTPRPALDTYS